MYRNQGTFPGDFLRFMPKPPSPYLEIAHISNILLHLRYLSI